MEKNSIFSNFKKNVVWQMLYQIISILMGVLIPYIVLRTYGSEINGLTNTARNMLTLVSLVRAGISTAITYSLYKPINEFNKPKIKFILNSVNKKFKIIAYWILFLGFLSSSIVTILSDAYLEKYVVFYACFLLCVNTSVDLWFTSEANVFLTALQKKYILSQGLLLGDFVMYVIQFISLLYIKNILLFYFAFSMASLLKIVFLLHVFHNEVKPYIDTVKYETEDFNEIYGIRYATINEIAHSVVFATPPIIVSFFWGFTYSSVLSVYGMVINGLSLVYQVFTSSFMPSFGTICAKENMSYTNKSFYIFQGFSMIIITYMYMCVAYLLYPFIELYTQGVKDINYVDSTLGILYILYGYFYAARIPYNIVVASTGLFKKSGLQTSLTACFTVLISVLACKYNYAYVLFGPIVFYSVNTFYQHYFLQKDFLGFKPKKFLNNLLISLLAITIMYQARVYIKIQFSNIIIYDFILKTAFAAVLSLVILLIIHFIFNKEILSFLFNKKRKDGSY